MRLRQIAGSRSDRKGFRGKMEWTRADPCSCQGTSRAECRQDPQTLSGIEDRHLFRRTQYIAKTISKGFELATSTCGLR